MQNSVFISSSIEKISTLCWCHNCWNMRVIQVQNQAISRSTILNFSITSQLLLVWGLSMTECSITFMLSYASARQLKTFVAHRGSMRSLNSVTDLCWPNVQTQNHIDQQHQFGHKYCEVQWKLEITSVLCGQDKHVIMSVPPDLPSDLNHNIHLPRTDSAHLITNYS
jgi:hypothetical protein